MDEQQASSAEPTAPRQYTVGALIALLQRFDASEPVQFMSSDAPEYGWLEVGGTWEGGYLRGAEQIANEDLEAGQ